MGRRAPMYLGGLGLVAAMIALSVVTIVPTGPVVRIALVGRGPVAVAIAERTDRVFVVNQDSDSVSVLTGSGRPVRTVAVGSRPAAIIVDARGGCAMVANQGDGTVSVLDGRSGRLRRTLAPHRDRFGAVDFIPQALVVDDVSGRVFVTGNGGRIGIVASCTTARMRIIGGLPTDASGGAAAVDPGTGRIFVVNSVDPGTGSTVSMIEGRHPLHARPSPVRPIPVGQGAIYVVDDARRGTVFVTGATGLVAIDARSGRVVRRVAMRAIYGQTVLDARRGQLIGAALGGRLALIDTRSGHVRYTRAAGIFPDSSTVEDERRGRIYVCVDSHVLVFNAATGAERTPIPAYGCDGGMAIAERSGYLFIADDRVPAPDEWAWLPVWLRHWMPGGEPDRRDVGKGRIIVVDTTR